MDTTGVVREWYKIEQHLRDARGWIRCLYDGKPTEFSSFEAASIALNDRSRFPARLTVDKWYVCVTYRIVSVVEKEAYCFNPAEEAAQELATHNQLDG